MSFRRFNLIAVSIAAVLSAATTQARPGPSPEQPFGGAAKSVSNGQSSSKSSPKKVVTLKAVSVKSRFISAKGHSALKMDVSARDTPFSISTYTGAFMHAVEATKVAELYPYMTGIQSAGITGYDLVFRGFQSGANDQNSILVDGLPGLATRFGSPATIGISRIDVVRGPSSVLNGEEQPGGFVNLITKKPEPYPLYELSSTVTTYDGAGVGIGDRPGLDFAADLTGPLDKDKRFLYRLIMEDSDKDTYRHSSYDRNVYFAPSLTWNISDRTSLTAAYQYQHLHYSYDTYLVAPDSNINLVAPITTRYQEPSDYEKEHGSVLSLFFNHNFGNGISWNIDTRDVWHTDQAHGFDVTAIRPDLLHVARRARGQINRRRYDYVDTNLHIPFDTFGISHKTVIGLTAGRDTLDANRLQFFNAPAKGPESLDISIYDPVYGQVPALSDLPLVANGSAKLLTDRYSVTESYGVYFADMMSLSEHWKATLGLRYARNHESIVERRVAGVPRNSKTNGKFLPMYGLVYQPNKHWSYYASYSTSYVPPAANAIDIHGVNSFVPTWASQIEAGSKANFMDGHLSATLALFRINEKNTFSHFPCAYGTCYQQLGKARSQGAEFEVNARPVDNWQLTAGYSYTDARITASTTPVQVNSRLPDVPYNSAHVWSRYDFTNASLEGLGFGVGVIYNGERQGFSPTKVGVPMLRLPAYTRVDTALYYSRGPYVVTFKVENLFDKTYYQSAGFNGDINLLPGTPRMFTLSVRAYFQ
ncbi:TonB-dependent receptor [Dyella sp. A6]|uniref:TonB-dependent siderophore receptor n=1 Tax=Dyella aluminiiresistens TaxID=3069105 RepID=UPI002E78E689|nr:TonB-dependent receptor [Dyella sp. A6]